MTTIEIEERRELAAQHMKNALEQVHLAALEQIEAANLVPDPEPEPTPPTGEPPIDPPVLITPPVAPPSVAPAPTNATRNDDGSISFDAVTADGQQYPEGEAVIVP